MPPGHRGGGQGRPPREGSTQGPRWGAPGLVALLALLSLLAGLPGLRKSLPTVAEVDEPQLVGAAVRVAASGDLNPAWFAAPGGPFIYPLAVAIRARESLVHGAPLLGPDPTLADRRKTDPTPYILLGRLASLLYWVASLPLLYLLGRRLFGPSAALAGTGLAAVLPPVAAYAQIARTDAASVFFGVLGLWLATRVYDRPSLASQALAGFVVGLGASTRYFMLAAAVMLAFVDIALCWRARRRRHGRPLPGIAVGAATIPLGFVLGSPFFLLDLETARRNLTYEARDTHVGADGLDGVGNVLWYLRVGLPDMLTWPLAACVLLGVLAALRRREPLAMGVLLYVAAFVLGTSRLSLHWARWLIPLLPLLALFAAHALHLVARHAAARGQARRAAGVLAAGLITLVAAQPLYQLVVHTAEEARTSTRTRARDWLLAHAAPGSRIFWEGYNQTLEGTSFDVTVEPTFVPGSYTRLVDRNYAYLVVTSATYDPYFAEPERYAGPVEKYRELFASGRLVAEFRPLAAEIGALPLLGRADCWCTVAPAIGDPTIRVYALDRR